MRNIALVLFSLLTIGCGRPTKSTPAASATSPATAGSAREESISVAEESTPWTEEEKRIAEIAKKAYFAKGSSEDDRTQVGKPLKHEDGTWSVVFWRLPAVPGGQTYVEISADGKVLGITGGK